MTTPTTHNPANPGAFDRSSDEPSKGDAKLLERIRTRFRYMSKAGEKQRERRARNMQALGPDGPWDPMERAARLKAKRPCVHLDQLNQYPNTLTNQFRQNPVGVKVKPAGNGSNEKTSTLRGDRMRAIHNESNGDQACETALRCAAEGGYGVITLETEEIEWDGFDQRIKIVREPDPDAVLYDPDCKEADSSDMQDAFKVWQMPMDEFKRKYGSDESLQVDFNLEDQHLAPEWINLDRQTVQVAKYSYFENTSRYVYLLDDGSPKGLKIFKDELPKGAKAKDGAIVLPNGASVPILKEKKAVERRVKRCTTNGLQILDRTDWPGKWIPVFPMLGKEKYVRTNNVTERVLESQIEHAIDGQRMFDSAKTNQVETANMVPKATYLGYEGQFDTSTDWTNINKVPTPFAEVKAIVDGATGQVLPLPQRTDFNPQIEPMEVMAEAARRAIQAAIGSHGFTINDDTNVKSGKAVNALKAQSDVGNFHFTDNAKITIRHLYRAINDLLDKIEDTDREVGIQKEDGTPELIRINAPYKDKTGQPVEHRYTPRDPRTGEPMKDAAHDVMISTGPSFEQQKDEASVHVQALMEHPAMGPRVADLAIKWLDLGPYGDQMAERLTLPEFQKQEGQEDIPPQVKQAMGQLDAQNKELTGAIQQLLQEREAKTAELQSKEKIAAMNGEIEKLKIQAQVRMKEIDAMMKGIIVHEQLSSAENLAQQQQDADRQIQELAHMQGLDQQQAGADQAARQSAQEHQQTREQQAQQAEAALTQQAAGAEQAAAAQTQAEQAAAQQQQAAQSETRE